MTSVYKGPNGTMRPCVAMRSTSLLLIVIVFGVFLVGDAARKKCRCNDTTSSSTTSTSSTTTTKAPEDSQHDDNATSTPRSSRNKKCRCGGNTGQNSTDEQKSTTKETTTPTTTTTSAMSTTTLCSCRRSRNSTRAMSSTATSTDSTTTTEVHDDTQWDLPLDFEAVRSGATCPNGWLRYHDSCYHMEIMKMERETAQRACDEKGATLFVADSEEEFREIATQAPLYFWSWIGLTQYDGTTRPLWSGSSGMDPLKIKWLISPFTSEANGWSKIATCAAFYNTENYLSTAYAYFYPCSTLYHSICERNMTLANL